MQKIADQLSERYVGWPTRLRYWSVIDIFTGWPVDYHGVVLDTLDGEEADRMVDVINLADMAKRGKLRHLR